MARFKEFLYKLESTNDFELSTCGLQGTICEDNEYDEDGRLPQQVETQLRALYSITTLLVPPGLRFEFEPGIGPQRPAASLPPQGASIGSQAASHATGRTSAFTSAGSRNTKTVNAESSVRQVQREYDKSHVANIVIMHENNPDCIQLLKSIGGSVFQLLEKVVTLFHWMNRLIPAAGVTVGSSNFQDSNSGIRYEMYDTGKNMTGSLLNGQHDRMKELAKNRPNLPEAFDKMMATIAEAIC